MGGAEGMMPKTVAIVQSNYIPWRGYFDLIRSCDEFILFDDVQFTKRDWRNRNQIKTSRGLIWLSIPVNSKGKYFQNICDTTISDRSWAKSHWTTISQNYGRAECFEAIESWLAPLYQQAEEIERLSDLNFLFLKAICDFLKIQTKISFSMDYKISSVEKNERLLSLCKAAGAERYLSGPSAKVYLDPAFFRKEGVEVAFIDYSKYPNYPQLNGDFAPFVSILDLIFNTGSRARDYFRGSDSQD